MQIFLQSICAQTRIDLFFSQNSFNHYLICYSFILAKVRVSFDTLNINLLQRDSFILSRSLINRYQAVHVDHMYLIPLENIHLFDAPETISTLILYFLNLRKIDIVDKRKQMELQFCSNSEVYIKKIY